MKENHGIKLTGKYRLRTTDIETGEVTNDVTKKNIVVDLGLNAIAQLLAGGGSLVTGEINYCAVGTGTTAAVPANTTLETELGRKAVTSSTFAGNKIYVSTYFTQTEVVGTIEEVGLFIDGTATPDSGLLFSRIVGGTELPITKQNTESLTVEYELTFSNL